MFNILDVPNKLTTNVKQIINQSMTSTIDEVMKSHIQHSNTNEKINNIS